MCDAFRQYEHHNTRQIAFLQTLREIFEPDSDVDEVAMKLLREM
jgi:hypothetical protein